MAIFLRSVKGHGTKGQSSFFPLELESVISAGDETSEGYSGIFVPDKHPLSRSYRNPLRSG